MSDNNSKKSHKAHDEQQEMPKKTSPFSKDAKQINIESYFLSNKTTHPHSEPVKTSANERQKKSQEEQANPKNAKKKHEKTEEIINLSSDSGSIIFEQIPNQAAKDELNNENLKNNLCTTLLDAKKAAKKPGTNSQKSSSGKSSSNNNKVYEPLPLDEKDTFSCFPLNVKIRKNKSSQRTYENKNRLARLKELAEKNNSRIFYYERKVQVQQKTLTFEVMFPNVFDLADAIPADIIFGKNFHFYPYNYRQSLIENGNVFVIFGEDDLTSKFNAKLEILDSWVLYSYIIKNIRGKQTCLDIKVNDLKTLYPKEFLNDGIVNFFMKVFEDIFTNSPTQKEVLVLKSFFFNLITNHLSASGISIESPLTLMSFPENCSLHSTKVNIFEYKTVFAPICEKSHWSLVIINNVDAMGNIFESEYGVREEKDLPMHSGSPNEDRNSEARKDDKMYPEIFYLDSYFHSLPRRIIIFFNFLFHEYHKIYFPNKRLNTGMIERHGSKIKKYVPKVPKQENNYDCGIFLLTYTELFLYNKDFFLKYARNSEFDTSAKDAGCRKSKYKEDSKTEQEEKSSSNKQQRELNFEQSMKDMVQKKQKADEQLANINEGCSNSDENLNEKNRQNEDEFFVEEQRGGGGAAFTDDEAEMNDAKKGTKKEKIFNISKVKHPENQPPFYYGNNFSNLFKIEKKKPQVIFHVKQKKKPLFTSKRVETKKKVVSVSPSFKVTNEDRAIKFCIFDKNFSKKVGLLAKKKNFIVERVEKKEKEKKPEKEKKREMSKREHDRRSNPFIVNDTSGNSYFSITSYINNLHKNNKETSANTESKNDEKEKVISDEKKEANLMKEKSENKKEHIKEITFLTLPTAARTEHTQISLSMEVDLPNDKKTKPELLEKAEKSEMNIEKEENENCQSSNEKKEAKQERNENKLPFWFSQDFVRQKRKNFRNFIRELINAEKNELKSDSNQEEKVEKQKEKISNFLKREINSIISDAKIYNPELQKSLNI